jgi:general secretion pathway protein H
VTPRRDRDAGVSLVEVLVVLAIVGIMAGVTTLGLGALDRGARSEAEALRLADRLQLAADEALVTGGPLALVWDDRGYRFLGWDAAGERWRASVQGDLGRRHELPAALRLAREDGGDGPVLIAPDLPQAPVVLAVAGGGVPGRVAFDGFAASAVAGD